jgi:hypothetical protein
MKRVLTVLNPETDEPPFAVVEGPAWGDVEFYAKWLAVAADAEVLWNKALNQCKFGRVGAATAVAYILDFEITATLLLSNLLNNRVSLMVDLWAEGGNEFVVMVMLGFFRLAGGRYQMTVPENLSIEAIKSSVSELARTDDGEHYMLHPEALVIHMSEGKARACRKRLRDMHQDLRISRRCRLLRDAA